MNALGKLLTATPRRVPVVCALLVLMYVFCVVLTLWLHKSPLLLLCGIALGLWSMLRAMDVIDLLRPESFLLPGLRRLLARATLIELALWLLPPTLAALALSGPLAAWRVFALLALAASLGVTAGAGRRWVRLLIWIGLMGVGWLPASLVHAVTSASRSPWAPIPALLLALLIAGWALKPLLRIDDTPVPSSPLAVLAARPGERSGGRAYGRGGPLLQRLRAISSRLAERELQLALTRYRQHATPTRLRTLLMQLALTVAVLAGYFVLTHAATRWDATVVGYYAVLIAIGRFQRLGRGLPKFRPQLAELYLLTAPNTRREFQGRFADTLLYLVGTTTITSLIYALAIVGLLHAHQPWRLLATVGATALGASLSALALFLIGPESRGGQFGVSMANLLLFAALYAGIYWLTGVAGIAIGASAGLVVSLAFGIGAWQTARREYVRRPPCFDAPVKA